MASGTIPQRRRQGGQAWAAEAGIAGKFARIEDQAGQAQKRWSGVPRGAAGQCWQEPVGEAPGM